MPDFTKVPEGSIRDGDTAIAYFMQDTKVFPNAHAVAATLDLYHSARKVQMNCQDHCVVAATLASGGVCPLTGKRVFEADAVQNCLSLMLTCGMHNRAGEFCYSIGLPANCGVSGCVMIVVPNVGGFVCFSPKLDKTDISKRAIEFAHQLVKKFKFHPYDIVNTGTGAVKQDPTNSATDEATVISMLYAAADGELEVLRYLANEGIDLNLADYDLRTALHLAAAENHYNVAYFLIQMGVTVQPKDRWGHTPLDEIQSLQAKYEAEDNEAEAEGCDHTVQLLQAAALGEENNDDRTLLIYNPPEGETNVSYIFQEEIEEPGDEDVYFRPKLRRNQNHLFKKLQSHTVPVLRNIQGKYMYVGCGQWEGEESRAHDVWKLMLSNSTDQGFLHKEALAKLLTSCGIQEGDKRLGNLWRKTTKGKLTFSEFEQYTYSTRTLFTAMIQNKLVIPNWTEFITKIELLYKECALSEHNSGKPAHEFFSHGTGPSDDPWAVAVCTVDGQQFNIGDVTHQYPVMGTCKPFLYCLARDLHGESVTHKHVGYEHQADGSSNTKIDLNSKDRPHNPMINSGAIMCCSLIHGDRAINYRDHCVKEMWKKVTGETSPPRLTPEQQVLMEKVVAASSSTNIDQASGFYMLEKKAFPPETNLEDTLELFRRSCFIHTTAQEHVIAAATLASGGICPITGERIFEARTVQNCLSLMLTCGMYDYSGESAYHIGLPCKSGKSGCTIIVVPNVCGIVAYSRNLAPGDTDSSYSTRGVAFAKALVRQFSFHQYDIMHGCQFKTDPAQKEEDKASSMAAQYLAYRGDVKGLQGLVATDVNVSRADYDGRTPLHLAAAEGHAAAIEFLLTRPGVSANVQDRWGNTPLDEAKRLRDSATVEKDKVEQCITMLKAAMDAAKPPPPMVPGHDKLASGNHVGITATMFGAQEISQMHTQFLVK
eukprot:TRINITY_DN52328_c0_g1_i3.p1 TRINITY_DN52328_c0_g1~~TRINITY_DN52328_c0_g1_i3.p1  ORF type:complete len:990 (+),score=86.22 TRINITY_DN52328_c0_g1_i3:164-2971(+)